MNKVPCYNTAICSWLYGNLFGDFITNARTDRYNLMCYLDAHDIKQPVYEYDQNSLGYRIMPKI